MAKTANPEVDQTDEQQDPTPPPAPRNVVEAILAVMREVRAVGKEGRNTQQNYNFRGIDATVNALGPAMRKHGLIVTPTLKSFAYGDVEVGRNRTVQAHAQVVVVYTFRHSNPENGEITSLEAEVPGESMDSGDKGTAKAMSVAFRIALLQTFALPTDEPDPDEFSHERSPRDERPHLTGDDVKAAIKAAWNAEDLDEAFSGLYVQFEQHRQGSLDQLQITTSEGDTLLGDAYVEHFRELAKEARAAKIAKDQDAAATSPDAPATASPAAEETPAEELRNQPEQPAEAAPQENPAPAPRPNPQQRFQLLAISEAEFQAEVLGIDAKVHAEPFLNKDGSISQTKAPKALIANRPLVIEALRELGRATEADNYERVGQGFPMPLSVLTDNAQDQAEEPVKF